MKRSHLSAIIAGLFTMPLLVFAHAHLEKSDPTNGSIMTAVPDHFLLMFSEAAHLTSMTLQKEGDADAQKIAPLPAEASTNFSVPAPKLTAGVYTLRFRNVAADDNHVTAGSIRFTVTGQAPAAARSSK